MPIERPDSIVDWTPPDGKGDALFGAGATRVEIALAVVAGVLGALIIVAMALVQSAQWNLFQYVVAALVTADLVSGAVANALNSAKRDHFGPPSATAGKLAGRLVRKPILFTAIHVYPIVVGLLFPPYLWWWGPAWYIAIVVGVILVRAVPLYLQRPVGFAVCALVALAAAFSPAPALWSWLPIVLALKLVLAHAVQEEPYRPISTTAQ